ncbi:hypothetical protein GXP67_32740 [Rhodocytophaga rosea]|uniref:STAS/SEC14 domain-containing protein n=1 Tax=Rhodocytophaga rosea TaxID=2704465 RepID=A0A6C0GTF2_9BACT|nr:hypothetical protein [Rhodocytophaga rosea]QHT71084.1 hypothetical protein GXP67_32740 [Rhodocytophaga rosea]
MTKILFEENFIVCYFNPEIPVLAHRWKSHPSSSDLRAALMRMITHFKELKKNHPQLTWCGDTTNLGVISLDTQAWLTKEWPGIMVGAGIKYHALVVPKDVFAKFAMNKFKNNLDDHHGEQIVISQFADESSAFQWLRHSVSLVKV